jgi:hypothetical protein
MTEAAATALVMQYQHLPLADGETETNFYAMAVQIVNAAVSGVPQLKKPPPPGGSADPET